MFSPALRSTFRKGFVTAVQMNTKAPFCAAALAPTVVHDEKQQKFVLPIEGHQAELLYRLKGTTIHLDHTEVPKELEGRGLGKILAKVGSYSISSLVIVEMSLLRDQRIKYLTFVFQVAFDHIAASNLKMKVHCHFLQHYLDKYEPGFKKYQV